MRRYYLLFSILFSPALLHAADAGAVHGLKCFYAWWMLLAGAIFSYVFYALWRMKKEEQVLRDKIGGIGWFAAALAVWSLSGLFELLVLSFMPEALDTQFIALCRSVFSTINSVCILFVIPSIDIKSEELRGLKHIVDWSKNKFSVLIFGASMIVVTSLLFTLFQVSADLLPVRLQYLMYLPDVLFSVMTIFALLAVFKAAFRDEKRHVALMVRVVYITILMTILAEIGLLFPSFSWLHALLPGWFNENGPAEPYFIFYNLSAIIFKMLLIVLFVILLYSYEIKKSEEYKLTELLSDEEIRQRWGLETTEVMVLRRLARGDTRDAIGSDEILFPAKRRTSVNPQNPPRTLPRKNVDDLLQNKIAPKLRLPNRESHILMFALQNQIVLFSHPTESNITDNYSAENTDEN